MLPTAASVGGAASAGAGAGAGAAEEQQQQQGRNEGVAKKVAGGGAVSFHFFSCVNKMIYNSSAMRPLLRDMTCLYRLLVRAEIPCLCFKKNKECLCFVTIADMFTDRANNR